MNRAVDSCSQMMSMMSSPLKLPFLPRNSFSPPSWSSSLYSEAPRDPPVGPVRVPLRAQHHVLGVADGPAGECAGALLDVLLRVAADAHREELQQLAAEVLVDAAFVVVVVVEPDDHGGVPGQLHKERSEAAKAVAPEHPYLVRQHLAVDHLRVTGGENAVPEQRRLLDQGGRSW